MASTSDDFYIWLPANSPGAVPQSKSESTNAEVASWYKSTLDQTYELDGDYWEVGLAEVCFPAKLLSHIEEEFEVGVRIMNPIEAWMKNVRQTYIESLAPGLEDFNYSLAHSKSVLDDRWEIVGTDHRSQVGLHWWSVQPTVTESKRQDLPTENNPTPKVGSTVVPMPAPPVTTTASSLITTTTTTAASSTGTSPVNPEPTTEVPQKTGTSETTPVVVSSVSPPQASKLNREKRSTHSKPIHMVFDSLGLHISTTESSPSFVPVSGIIKKQAENATVIVPPRAKEPRRLAGDVDPTTAKGTFKLGQAEKRLQEQIRGWESENTPYYFKRRLFPLALGKHVQVEHEDKPALSKIGPAFYSSRAELVSIINERLYLVLHSRSYPGHWAELLFEPALVIRDNGIVTVAAGFHEPLNGSTSNLIYLVPTISSLKVIRFLGLDVQNWIYDETLKTYAYRAGHRYARRDSEKPVSLAGELRMEPKADIDPLVTFSKIEKESIDNIREAFHWSNWDLKTWDKTDHELLSTALQPKFNVPEFVYIYSDIAAPVTVGNTGATILRITTLATQPHPKNKKLMHRPPEKYAKVFFSPVSRRRFDTIEIFLSDENGSELAFEDGTVFVVLEFRKRVPIMSALSHLLQ